MRPPLLQSAFAKLGESAVKCIEQMLILLRGQLTLRDNVRLETKSGAAAGTADTEFSIDISALKLSVAPTYLLTLQSDNGGVLYASSLGSWTAGTIKAKCTKASTNFVIGVM